MSRIFMSRFFLTCIFMPRSMVPHFHVSYFHDLHFWWCRNFISRIFSRPLQVPFFLGPQFGYLPVDSWTSWSGQLFRKIVQGEGNISSLNFRQNRLRKNVYKFFQMYIQCATPVRYSHWRCHKGGVGARALPLGAYSVTQNSAKNAPKHVIFTQKNPKIFWGWGSALHRTLPKPTWGVDTPPHTSPLKCPTTIRSCYASPVAQNIWAYGPSMS